MFRRFRSSIAWVRLLSRFRRGDFVGAAQEAARFRAIGLTKPAFEALDATIDILNRRSEEAKIKFQYVINWLDGRPNPEDKYIYLYSLYYLSLIDEKPDADERRKDALLLATPRLMRTLPLPPSPVE